jgi:hypothetical protein
MLQEIRCPSCNKFVCEAVGEVTRECKRCKKQVHAVTSAFGVIYFGEAIPPNGFHIVSEGKVSKFVIK